MEGKVGRCKIVVVGDTQCGKTALLHVFAKDSYPETYVPTVFENYTASFEIDKRRIELNMWDTSGSSYYDNVRPLAYPDADAVLICFDVSRPETLESVLKKWQGETQEYCPNAKVVLTLWPVWPLSSDWLCGPSVCVLIGLGAISNFGGDSQRAIKPPLAHMVSMLQNFSNRSNQKKTQLNSGSKYIFQHISL
uniref:Rho family GTPase 2 n=1 Tax=Astyanax mexicanus TaxID=7994 RepID=A0A3B1IST1_ASTMX